MSSYIPEIPHNKLYHLFVCYEKNSIDIVQCIVDNLEKKGIICCYYDRDFLPGRSILENMYDAIQKSLNMLIVLSEEFENSCYCMHEVEEAINLKVREEYSLIPIKTEPCSVPERLQHLVYIDVEDEIDRAHDKIIDALIKKDRRDDLKKDRSNGECMQFAIKPYTPSRLSLTRYKLKFTESERAKIWRDNFEVSADLLQDIEDTVNGSLFVKYLHVWDNIYGIVCNMFLHLLIPVVIVCLVLLITTSGREKAVSFQPVGYALSIGLPLLFLSFVVSLVVCVYHQLHEKGIFGVQTRTVDMLKAQLWNISKQNNTHTGVVFFINKDFLQHAYMFYIMRYNFKRCKVYFSRHLGERKELNKYRKKNETNEEYTSRLFDKFLSNASENLLSSSTSNRHQMENGAKCVCLLVEECIKSE